jgi:hypothetical protein
MPRRERSLPLLVSLLALLVPTTSTLADTPIRFTFEVDETVFAPALSAACGFDVFVTTEGTANVLLFLDKDGSGIAREIDWNAGWTITFTAPTLGTSYSQTAAGPLIATYPEGNDVGDPATVSISGLNRKIGDDPAEAGRLVFDAVVVFVEPTFGIPAVQLLGLISEAGHFLGNPTARRCETLAAA